VFYVAPCGRRLRSEQEVDRYLMLTDSRLTIDMFCFEPDLRVDVEFVSTRVRCYICCCCVNCLIILLNVLRLTVVNIDIGRLSCQYHHLNSYIQL
jgi:hypothetical protein